MLQGYFYLLTLLLVVAPHRSTSDIVIPRADTGTVERSFVKSRANPLHYTPTSIIISTEAMNLLAQDILNLLGQHLTTINIPDYHSGSGCETQYSFWGTSVTLNMLTDPSFTVTSTGLQISTTLTLQLVFTAENKWAKRVLICLEIECTATGRTGGNLGITLGVALGVDEVAQSLVVSISQLQITPSNWKTSIHFGPPFYCSLLQDIAELLGIHISQLANSAVTGILGSPSFSESLAATINANLLSYAGKAVSNAPRMCAIVNDPLSQRIQFTVPNFVPTIGYVCPKTGGAPPWRQFICGTQDIMVIASLEARNMTLLQLWFADASKFLFVGGIIRILPSTVQAALNVSSLQVCVSENIETLEDFWAMSIALQPLPKDDLEVRAIRAQGVDP